MKRRSLISRWRRERERGAVTDPRAGFGTPRALSFERRHPGTKNSIRPRAVIEINAIIAIMMIACQHAKLPSP
jgi:hypothetical protein